MHLVVFVQYEEFVYSGKNGGHDTVTTFNHLMLVEVNCKVDNDTSIMP